MGAVLGKITLEVKMETKCPRCGADMFPEPATDCVFKLCRNVNEGCVTRILNYDPPEEPDKKDP